MTKQLASKNEAVLDNTPLRDTGLVSFFERLTPDPEENISIILQETGKALGSDFGLYCLVDEEKSLLFLREGYKIPREFDRPIFGKGHVCYDKSMWRSPDPVIIENLEATRFAETDTNIKKFGFKSYIGIGVPLEGNLPGCLCMFYKRRKQFLPSEIEKLVVFSRALSLEEKRRKSFKDLTSKLSLEEMLFETSSRALSMRSLRAFLHECVEIIGRTLDVGGIFIWKYDEETDTVSNVASDREGVFGLQQQDSRGIPAVLFPWDLEQMKQEGVLQYDDIETLIGGKEKETLRELNLKSMLMFPLFSKDVFYGTLGIEVYDRPRKWSQRVIAALTSVSNVMAKSIEGYISEQELQKAKDGLEEQVTLRTEKLKTALKALERERDEALHREAEMEELSQELLEMNKAVTVLARNVRREKNAAQKEVSLLISSKVMPLIGELRQCKNLDARRSDLDVIYGYLNDIGIGMAGESCGQVSLTVSEMKVAALISRGFTSLQIANKLNVSLHTIKTHRKRIRKKLNVQNTKTNLSNYLNHLFQTEALQEQDERVKKS